MVTGAAARSPTRSGRQGTAFDNPVLTSKITVPGVPGWAVPRPRIDNLIAQGARRPLTLVAGPAGAGKTMALALWADAQPGAIAWVTLDDYDNRPKVFWSYVMAALRRAGVALPRALSAAARGYGVDHVFLLRFASAMAVQDPPVTLILDDLHVVTEPKVLDGLGYVLRNAGPGLHLMASSRMDPLLPLHRYRLSGQLTEIRTDDLTFSIPESRLLMAQHGITLSAESLECLTRRAEGWAAGLRLAAISMAGSTNPDQFIKDFAAEDSAVTGYLVEEVLDAQSAPIRDFLLRTSILDRVSADIASELADDEPPPGALPALARTNAFVLSVGHGWYRYHSLFAAVLRLRLRRDFPGQVQDLHRRAARWYRRNGALTEAVRHAAHAGDWQFAARTVVDELAVGQLIEPRGNERLADEFRRMALGPGWTEAQPLLVAAAIQLSQAEDERSGASLGSAESMLDHLPDDDEVPSRLAATLIRLALSRRTGDLGAATAAAAKAEILLEAIPQDLLARHPGIRAQVLAARGAVEFWSGHLDKATATLDAGVLAACATDSQDERADCLGHLALLEALQGRLRRAAELAAKATGPPENDSGPPTRSHSPAAEVALACVHLERNELALAHGQLKRADDALRARPDKLISVAACLVAGRHCLAEGRASAVSEIVGRARHGWPPPSWLDRRLKLLESRASAAMSDIQSAVETATSVGPGSSLDAAVALAHAWLAAGDSQAAARALASASGGAEAPDWVRLHGWLMDAQLSYGRGDRGRGRRSLEHALRLGEPEQLRLPFAMERAWIRPVLRSDPDLAHAYRRLLEPDLVSPGRVLAQKPGTGQAGPLIVEQLSEREREVLRLVSAMLSTAEMAAEMYISVNTVKSHLKSIYRKLAVTQRGEAVRRARQLELL
jgi:LuxR family maltose regulon positive regulatory protein